jgi:carboxymethylenebutenolidase
MSEVIELIAHDGHRFGAWLAEPDDVPHGAVIVVQEIFGVNRHIRALTHQLSQLGYLAIAPMLFDRVARGIELGYDESGISQGRVLAEQVGFDHAVRDVAAVAQYASRAGRVGVVGYCWGGTVAFLANTRLKLPAVSYYGGRTLPFLHEKPGHALLMHFGEKDKLIPPEHVMRISSAIPTAEVLVYAAGHGFNCNERADYDEVSAQLALERTLAFFRRLLRD